MQRGSKLAAWLAKEVHTMSAVVTSLQFLDTSRSSRSQGCAKTSKTKDAMFPQWKELQVKVLLCCDDLASWGVRLDVRWALPLKPIVKKAGPQVDYHWDLEECQIWNAGVDG